MIDCNRDRALIASSLLSRDHRNILFTDKNRERVCMYTLEFSSIIKIDKNVVVHHRDDELEKIVKIVLIHLFIQYRLISLIYT